jgi:hypothetical protein
LSIPVGVKLVRIALQIAKRLIHSLHEIGRELFATAIGALRRH